MTVTDQSGKSVYRPFPSFAAHTKRKVFISYHHGDEKTAANFVSTFGGPYGVFTHRALGLSYTDDLINSKDTEYVMRCIRERYLEDSTVTIVLLGTCTHSRRYVDWEIKASLQQGEKNPNGLIGIVLPGNIKPPNLPPRFSDNLASGYALLKHYPRSSGELSQWIEEAFLARAEKAHLIYNGLQMMGKNSKCLHCGETHLAG